MMVMMMMMMIIDGWVGGRTDDGRMDDGWACLWLDMLKDGWTKKGIRGWIINLSYMKRQRQGGIMDA